MTNYVMVLVSYCILTKRIVLINRSNVATESMVQGFNFKVNEHSQITPPIRENVIYRK